MTGPLDLAPFAKAVDRLLEGLDRCRREPGDLQVRDGLIQRFEFTYELAHKTLKRHLEAVVPDPTEVDRWAFADLIRVGFERGLLHQGWPAWRTFRDMRARTSHTYDESTASAVVDGIPDFLQEARFLLDRLQGESK